MIVIDNKGNEYINMFDDVPIIGIILYYPTKKSDKNSGYFISGGSPSMDQIWIPYKYIIDNPLDYIFIDNMRILERIVLKKRYQEMYFIFKGAGFKWDGKTHKLQKGLIKVCCIESPKDETTFENDYLTIYSSPNQDILKRKISEYGYEIIMKDAMECEERIIRYRISGKGMRVKL